MKPNNNHLPTMLLPDTAEEFVLQIRNPSLRRYAEDYLAYVNGSGIIPHHGQYDLTRRVAGAIELTIDALQHQKGATA